MNRIVLIFVVLFSLLTPFSRTSADELSATGGLSFGRNSGFNDIKIPSPNFGAELTFSTGPHLQLGGFFDRALLQFKDDTAGSLNFMGMVARYHFVESGHSGPFVYGKAGLGSMCNNTMNSNQNLSYGSGLGYQIVLTSVLSLSPRMGVSFLPDSPASGAPREARYDGGVMVSLHF